MHKYILIDRYPSKDLLQLIREGFESFVKIECELGRMRDPRYERSYLRIRGQMKLMLGIVPEVLSGPIEQQRSNCGPPESSLPKVANFYGLLDRYQTWNIYRVHRHTQSWNSQNSVFKLNVTVLMLQWPLQHTWRHGSILYSYTQTALHAALHCWFISV